MFHQPGNASGFYRVRNSVARFQDLLVPVDEVMCRAELLHVLKHGSRYRNVSEGEVAQDGGINDFLLELWMSQERFYFRGEKKSTGKFHKKERFFPQPIPCKEE